MARETSLVTFGRSSEQLYDAFCLAYLIDRIEAHCGSVAEKQALDLGAGTGMVTAVLADGGARVTAVEPAVDSARQNVVDR